MSYDANLTYNFAPPASALDCYNTSGCLVPADFIGIEYCAASSGVVSRNVTCAPQRTAFCTTQNSTIMETYFKTGFDITLQCRSTSAGPVHGPSGFLPMTLLKQDASRPASLGTSDNKTSPASSEERLTWRNYDPDGGLPLPSGDLKPTELNAVFSEKVEDAEVGNWIIRLMNWRRQSGALIDKQIDFPRDFGVSRKQAYEALVYLRKTFPDFDEQSAGVAWAEEQINQVSSEYVARAEKLGIYRKDTSVEHEDEVPLSSSDVYGESQLVEMRRSNEAKAKAVEEERLAREKAEEQARLMNPKAHTQAEGAEPRTQKPPGQNPNDELGVGASGSATLARPVQRAAWVRKYEEAALLTKETTPPTTSKIRRLVPSLLVTLGVLGLSYLLHEAYVPSPNSARYFPDTPPALATIGAVTGIMFTIFFAYRMPPLWRIMNKYFVTSPGAPTAPSIFLSTFTHQTFGHLFINTVFLWSFGRYLHEDVGRGTFLAIFLATGTLANWTSLAYFVARNQWSAYCYGSSTAIYGVIAATCLLRSDHDATILGYRVPLTGLMVLGVFTMLEVVLLLRGGPSARGINFVAHFAGLAYGAACAGGIRYQANRKKQEAEAFTNTENLMVRKEADGTWR
ncbi:Rhomboid-like protein 1 [Elsinoe fawcettii]|nr:Rhomboid-like protein 1 [Elsinoe fawcettii]